MKLTGTKVQFMHGQCSTLGCPVCSPSSSIPEITEWLQKHLTVIKTGSPKSPWWEVLESNPDCYKKLRGNLRQKGYYDR